MAGYENQLQKAIRLLNEFNCQMNCSEPMFFTIEIYPFGGGRICTARDNEACCRTTLFNFDTPEELFEFLQADQFNRLDMVKNQ